MMQPHPREVVGSNQISLALSPPIPPTSLFLDCCNGAVLQALAQAFLSLTASGDPATGAFISEQEAIKLRTPEPLSDIFRLISSLTT